MDSQQSSHNKPVSTEVEADGVDNLLSTNDAVVWAKEFNKVAQNLGYSKMDEEWLVGWFANAMAAQEFFDQKKQSCSEFPGLTKIGVMTPDDVRRVRKGKDGEVVSSSPFSVFEGNLPDPYSVEVFIREDGQNEH